MSDDQYMDYVIENQIAPEPCDHELPGTAIGIDGEEYVWVRRADWLKALRRHGVVWQCDTESLEEATAPAGGVARLVQANLRKPTADASTCPVCHEVVHDHDCRLIGDGRPFEFPPTVSKTPTAPDALCGFEDCGSEQSVRWHRHDDSCRYGGSGNHPPYAACLPFTP